MENYRQTEEKSEDKDSSESVTYVEISSVDHPEAYGVLSEGNVIRRSAPVNALYADLTACLGQFFESGDKMPLVRWILEDGEGNLDEETLAELLSDHDLETVESDN